jgi:hypothetical protein
LTFIEFANQASNSDSPLKQSGAELAATKTLARMVSGWIGGRNGNKSIMISIAPLQASSPQMSARLDEAYLVGGTQLVEGNFTVIAQVASLIAESEAVPAIRIFRDTPPTSSETDVITSVLQGLIEPAAELGVEITDADITLLYPGVIVHPIAIYR